MGQAGHCLPLFRPGRLRSRSPHRSRCWSRAAFSTGLDALRFAAGRLRPGRPSAWLTLNQRFINKLCPERYDPVRRKTHGTLALVQTNLVGLARHGTSVRCAGLCSRVCAPTCRSNSRRGIDQASLDKASGQLSALIEKEIAPVYENYDQDSLCLVLGFCISAGR